MIERRPVVTTIRCEAWDDARGVWVPVPDFVAYDDGSVEEIPADFPWHFDPGKS